MYQPASGFGDPNAYRAIFFEETQEHLAQVESLLLRLQPGEPCGDELNAIFRAIHSIKGSAAMLGCDDMAALAHLQENLLDVLRKDERPVEAGDIEALLKAGDVIRGQALRHAGSRAEAPDSARAEALLRAQLERPRSDAPSVAGPIIRNFHVQLGPLAQPLAHDELETMLQGLAEMGELRLHAAENLVGATLAFDIAIEGTAADLHSVVSLLVAPELVSIDKADAASVEAPAPQPETAPAADELFIDPAEFRKQRTAAPTPAAEAADAVPDFVPAPVELAHIRVATEKIDALVNLVGELVITEAMLARSGQDDAAGPGGKLAESGLADLARHTRNLQQAVLAIRMLPISNVFSRFPRLVHELAARLGKQVELRIAGEATELDRGLIEKISDPLTHLVRNAVDHGLEQPEARMAAGKPAAGTVQLRASQRGGNIVIEVSDDGQGLDRERILARAAERGHPLPADAPDAAVWQLVFEPGFSTAREVTDLSGRGVGMDVVRRNIQALGGTVELASVRGEGMTVTVSVPLTLAIVEGMTLRVGCETYVLPLASVVESVPVGADSVHRLPGRGETLRVRDEYLPVLRLADLFPPRSGAGEGGIAVILETDAQCAALVVDELLGQQQVVVKSLEANFRKVPGLAGATVMGDGAVALILDPSHLVRRGAAQAAVAA